MISSSRDEKASNDNYALFGVAVMLFVAPCKTVIEMKSAVLVFPGHQSRARHGPRAEARIGA